MIAIVIPVVAIVFGCSIAIFGIYFDHQKKKLLHETVRLALERGQPIPPEIMAQLSNSEEDKPAGPRRPENDIRTGLILIAVGAGVYLFFAAMSVEKMRFVGAIPGLIGVALLLFGVINTALSRKKSNDDLAPRS
ncbi:MAG: DUF6249 domain-containing protein [Verrucomicrobiota bacterium]